MALLGVGLAKGVSQILLHVCLAKPGDYNLPLDSELHIPKKLLLEHSFLLPDSIVDRLRWLLIHHFFHPLCWDSHSGAQSRWFEVICKAEPGGWGSPCPSCSWQCPTQTAGLPDTGDRHDHERKLLFWDVHLLRAPDKRKNYQDQAALRAKS